MFRALAHPTRREILQLLRAAPRTSGEIGCAIRFELADGCHVIRVLKDAVLVTTERSGHMP